MVYNGKLSSPTLIENPRSFHKIKISTQSHIHERSQLQTKTYWSSLEIPSQNANEDTHSLNLAQLVSQDVIA